jgi:hypothetical protein
VVQQRAPRLRPDQRIADSMTRVGRFAKIDPLEGRDLPTLVHVIATFAWLGLVIESFRRARAAVRAPAEQDDEQLAPIGAHHPDMDAPPVPFSPPPRLGRTTLRRQDRGGGQSPA